MAYFEEHGYNYTAYTIDPDGTVTSNTYNISASQLSQAGMAN